MRSGPGHDVPATRQARVAAALVVALLVLLTGCTGGSESGSSGTVSGIADEGGGSTDANAAREESGRQPTGASRTAVQTRAVISTGEVAVTSKQVGEVLERVDRLLERFDGFVEHEETGADEQGNVTSSRLTVRLPAPRFQDAIEAFEGLGKLEHSQTQTEDITTKVIDVGVRVRAQEKALQRLEEILRAGANLDEVIRLETEIAERQAELDSLKSQQAYLADQTSLSTITLYLSTPQDYVQEPDALEDAGFLAGVRGGWQALKIFLVAASTMLGAALPFGFTIALVAGPLWLLTRAVARRRTGEAAVPEPAPEQPAS